LDGGSPGGISAGICSFFLIANNRKPPFPPLLQEGAFAQLALEVLVGCEAGHCTILNLLPFLEANGDSFYYPPKISVLWDFDWAEIVTDPFPSPPPFFMVFILFMQVHSSCTTLSFLWCVGPPCIPRSQQLSVQPSSPSTVRSALFSNIFSPSSFQLLFDLRFPPRFLFSFPRRAFDCFSSSFACLSQSSPLLCYHLFPFSSLHVRF